MAGRTTTRHFLGKEHAARRDRARELLSRYERGDRIEVIASDHGVHPVTVRKAIRFLGVSIRGHKTHADRFWLKVNRSGPGGCWIWTGRFDRKGYGSCCRMPGLRTQLAHRVSYTLLVGPIQAGMTIDHVCRVRRCVNPGHLRVCTVTENVMAPWSMSPPKVNAGKTHCLRGHEFTGANLYVDPKRGWRQCLACRRIRAASR